MSELHHGLVAVDPRPKDFGWNAPYVTIGNLWRDCWSIPYSEFEQPEEEKRC